MYDIDKPWPKLTAETMNYRGARALASAILLATAEDYYKVCDHPIRKKKQQQPPQPTQWLPVLKTREMIERFIDSELFFVISDVEPKEFRRRIQKMKEQHIPFPRSIIDTVRNNMK